MKYPFASIFARNILSRAIASTASASPAHRQRLASAIARNRQRIASAFKNKIASSPEQIAGIADTIRMHTAM